MVVYGLDLAQQLSSEQPLLVVGHGAEEVAAVVGSVRVS